MSIYVEVDKDDEIDDVVIKIFDFCFYFGPTNKAQKRKIQKFEKVKGRGFKKEELFLVFRSRCPYDSIDPILYFQNQPLKSNIFRFFKFNHTLAEFSSQANYVDIDK